MFMFLFPLMFNEHLYTLAATGMKIKSQTYTSRESANRDMYEIISKNHLHIVKQYNDKHFRTYICDNGVRFYVNRI